jgi:hypothetical protein
MERTVPSTASEEVELYLRTYYSLLRSTSVVQIRALEEVHGGMNSLLHPRARKDVPDMSAFIYCLLRLPTCIHQVRLIVLGQSPEVFKQRGIGDVETWEPVTAIARKRRCYFNGEDVLACFIASRSDIDDILPMLTAYQIEWNKFHERLQRFKSNVDDFDIPSKEDDLEAREKFSEILEISIGDLDRLQTVCGDSFEDNIVQMQEKRRELGIQLLSGSLSDYRRATNDWWGNIERSCDGLSERQVYFISSNPHSLTNLLSGFALEMQSDLVQYLEETDHNELLEEWNDIQSQQVVSSRENFLYYALKKIQSSSDCQDWMEEQLSHERTCGISRISSEHSFDVDTQAIEVSSICPDLLDPRLVDGDLKFLSESDAVILNIDYPLGLAAYNILSEVSARVGSVLGVYIIGKAASLNGAVGDVVIPNVIHDEHSQNSYLFENSFIAADIVPYLMYGTVMDNQKSVSVRGTFLQNEYYMDVFYREGYTDIEMEGGPYLSAVYEMYRPKRHPMNEIVNLYGVPFDLGVAHYVSDTPLSKGSNLGAGSLSYFGMDSTYAVSLAVLRRIFELERNRIYRQQKIGGN